MVSHGSLLGLMGRSDLACATIYVLYVLYVMTLHLSSSLVHQRAGELWKLEVFSQPDGPREIVI